MCFLVTGNPQGATPPDRQWSKILRYYINLRIEYRGPAVVQPLTEDAKGPSPRIYEGEFS